MRVELAGDLFPKPPSTVQLDALASVALQGRHRIIVADDQDADFRQWFDELPPDHRDEWSLILADAYETEAIEPARRSIGVKASGETNWESNPPELPLNEAVEFLQLPFMAMLEDWSSDRRFLSAVASPEQRSYLEKMEQKGALQFDNGGGISNMPKRIKVLADIPGTTLRLWVLFDGDGLVPGAPSADSERMRNRCVESCVPHHQLTRRNIENYITEPALKAWAVGQHRAVRTRKVRALFRMTDPQRHHFNMKNGFAKDAKRRDANAGTLFDSVSHRDRETLSDGFGDQIADLLDPQAISEADLKADGSWAELKGIVSDLVELVR
jgi:hypothetical protein